MGEAKARGLSMRTALLRVEQYGSDGVSEAGCVCCHELARLCGRDYPVKHQIHRVHFVACPVGRALGRKVIELSHPASESRGDE